MIEMGNVRECDPLSKIVRSVVLAFKSSEKIVFVDCFYYLRGGGWRVMVLNLPNAMTL